MADGRQNDGKCQQADLPSDRLHRFPSSHRPLCAQLICIIIRSSSQKSLYNNLGRTYDIN